ncbi:sugar dehydrogenase complex small subunit [Rhizobium lusitanum]|uniref:Membrane bound FAD containing D-sorbitol dehydrogenase n=1 Tax=Rhizobium lusitanum TaxID=293958 RepID=A0A7X0MBQ2_9HYPH|nr:sugar dehydrogenase complex small subunit [Rhizobium lusitanum]MBB6484749.1 hypothetical protein [Rhizobium lusitanum]
MNTPKTPQDAATAARSNAKAPAITRRSLLAGTTLLLAGLNVPKAFADTPSAAEAAFYIASSVLTDKRDLSPITSKRIFQILNADDSGFADKAIKLAVLAKANVTGTSLKMAAAAAGLDAIAMKIVSTWYTGTVETAHGPVVVAYKDALMYRPVADGLTVPTYCNNGPMWWIGLPPEVTRMPVNSPRVL